MKFCQIDEKKKENTPIVRSTVDRAFNAQILKLIFTKLNAISAFILS